MSKKISQLTEATSIATTDEFEINNAGTSKRTTWQTLLDAIPSSDTMPKGHISGLILSNDTDTAHDISITAGEARDSADTYDLTLSSAMVKQIDATWAAGTNAGGLFSGSVAIDTWYHVFLIRKDSDGSIDAGFDTSVTAANIPTGYTAYRRIGSVLTDGSANILGFQQFGKVFFFDSPLLDVNTSASTTSKTLRTLSVPTGVSVLAKFNVMSEHSAASDSLYVSHPDATDLAPTTSATPLASTGGYNTAANAEDMSQLECFTNISSQIATRSSANNDLRIATLGWEDYNL